MNPQSRLPKVVFLDRDGVINRDSPDYIKSWSEFEFLPGSLEAIRDLTRSGFSPIVVTNQSAVSRRLLSRAGLAYIHRMMRAAIEAHGGRILDIFFCPHLPSDGCRCRKPAPGMLYQAQKKHRIDLAAAVMVGDRVKDMECARNAGCGRAILVQTGNGHQARAELAQSNRLPDYVAENLYAAAEWIIKSGF
ncbi:MAG: D-glycero-beta-D-manno-heptose 1,7-bisphosphate 7-phosphatase [Desulfobacterales bacterium]|nr:MAG: D-glycero-beta-D-manno-heptose 1,7-bisphosphate 7-phosphatase [Desulfobacterales bacterium]